MHSKSKRFSAGIACIILVCACFACARSSPTVDSLIDGVWYTVGTPGAAEFTGSYTTGPALIEGVPLPSLEYMKSGNTMNLQGTLHLKSSPGQPGVSRVCVLPLGCAPSSRHYFVVVFINYDVSVMSDQDFNPGSWVDVDGSVWIASPAEAITDVYINDSGGPIQWAL
jgi:hypothetical protein